jgi:dihydrofolate synthase/folylpolyglutamate synthase
MYFADMNVDVAVVEVGMGGRLDATNIIQPQLSVITNIGRDHAEQLGNTLAAIAREKAGIIKPGVPVVAGACQPEVIDVIEEVAARRRADVISVCASPWSVISDGSELRLSMPEGESLRFTLDLPGVHQRHNALVAVASARQVLPRQGFGETVVHALSRVRKLSGLRARCEIVRRRPLVVVDVAHNEEGIRAAMECLDREAPEGHAPYVMLGLARDKDLEAILDVLSSWNPILMPIAMPGDRGRAPSAIARSAVTAGLRIVEIDSAAQGWEHFREHAGTSGRLLIAGSHYLVGTLPGDLFPRRTPTSV